MSQVQRSGLKDVKTERNARSMRRELLPKIWRQGSYVLFSFDLSFSLPPSRAISQLENKALFAFWRRIHVKSIKISRISRRSKDNQRLRGSWMDVLRISQNIVTYGSEAEL